MAGAVQGTGREVLTSDEQRELSALLGKATGAHCYLTLAQKQRLKELLNKRNNKNRQKEQYG